MCIRLRSVVFLFFALHLFIANNGYSQAPGGVTGNLDLWLKADAGVTGTNVSTWADQSGNGNNATQGTGGNQPVFTNPVLNFNPAIDFDGTNDYLGGGAGGYSDAYYLVIVPDDVLNSGTTGQIVFGLNSTTSGNDFGGLGFGDLTGAFGDEVVLHLDGASGDWRSGLTGGSQYNSAAPLIIAVRENAASPTYHDLFINGISVYNDDAGTFRSITDEPYNIGRANPASPFGTFSFDGKVAEVVTYTARTSDANHSRIQSYLAIKYGITLDQSGGAVNYVRSDGNTVWNATTNAGFNNDIIAIGRDDNSGLNQKQSRSVNTGAVLNVGLGSIAASNSANGSTFSTDNSFLVIGHNGGTKSIGTTYNGGALYGSARIWKTEGTVGTVRLQFNKSEVSTYVESIYVKNGDATLGTGGTTYALTDGGTFWYADINLADGDYFAITTSTPPPAPGGVSGQLSLWLRGDAGTTIGTGVSSWADQSESGNDASQGSGTLQPALTDGQINYNPALYFNGDELDGAGGFNTHEYFIITQPDITPVDNSANGFLVGFENNEFGGLYFGDQIDGYIADDIIVHAIGDDGDGDEYRVGFTTGAINEPVLLVNSRNDAGATAQEILVNNAILPVTVDGVGFLNLSDQAYRVGDNLDGDNSYSGYIAEVISFDSRLADTDRNKVLTYLYLKYGISPVSSNLADLAASDGTILWDVSTNLTFSNGIAGIGRDDNSGLNQKQSTSMLPSSILSVGLGTIAATNSANGNSFASDMSYVVWGHNDGPVSISGSYNAGAVYGLGRVWQVEEIGTVGIVRLQIMKSEVPSGLTSLYVKNGDPALGAGGTSYALTDGGTVWYADVDLNGGDYFTFTGPVTAPVAPGDVYSGLATWLKADAGVTQAGGTVSAWNDQAGLHHALQGTAADQPGYTTSQINGNPALYFSGDDFMDASAGFYTREYFTVVVPNEVYSSATSVGTILSFENNNFSKLGLGPATNYADNEIITHALGGYNGSYRSAFTSTTVSLVKPAVINSRNNAGGTGQDIYYNGSLVSNVEVDAAAFYNLSDYAFRIGDNMGDWAGSNFAGYMGEMISYTRRLTDAERRDVVTYLAIKYGITLDISSQGYTVSGTPVYNNTSYSNDIAGIGSNASQGLSQTSSKSINSGSVVKVSGPSDLGEGEYLIWGNDGGANTFTISDVPVGATERLEKIWTVTETGDVGTVNVSFDITSLGINGSFSALNLFIAPAGSTIPDDFAGIDIITGGILSVEDGRDIITFSNVDFTDGDFFTLGGDVQTQAPGGISANLSVWLRADDGVISSGSSVSDWLDRSGNANDAFQGNTGVQPTLDENEINYNPAIDFTGDYIDGVTGFHTAEYFIVAKPDIAIDGSANGFLLGFEQGKFGGLYFGDQTDGYVPNDRIVHAIGDNGDGDEYRRGLGSGTISDPVVIVSSRNNIGNTQQELAVNGGPLAATDYGTYKNLSNQSYRLGDNLADDNNYQGFIAEVISYSSRMSDTDRRDVETYLALKYGATLDISSQAYTSGGVAIFNHTTYDSDIAGIGMDLDKALNQPVSMSQNAGAMVKMEDATDLDNGDYLIWGNDGTNKTNVQTTEIPAGYDERLAAEWRVAVTGSPGTVTVKMYVGGITNYAQRQQLASLYTLLTNTTNDFSTAASSYDGSSFSGDTVVFNGVSFSNNDFFTLVVPPVPASPAGVTVWLRGDDGITLNGPVVSAWANQVSSSITSVTQGTNANRPTYTTDALNGHAILDFDGTNDVLTATVNSLNLVSDQQAAMLAVMRVNEQAVYIEWDEGSDANNAIALANNGDAFSYYFPRSSRTANGSATVVNSGSFYVTSGISTDGGALTTNRIYVNGTLDGTSTGTANTLSGSNDDFRIGDGDGTGNADMELAEVLVYNTGLTATEQRDMETYLAIKYGISLDISTQDYTYNGGTSIYGQTAFANDIAGIGAYNDLGLAQNASASINSSAIVRVFNPSSLNSGDFLVWGHDGGSVATTTTANIPPGILARITRVWAVEQTNDPGTVSVSVDLTGQGYGAYAAEDFRLLVASSPTTLLSLNVPTSFSSEILTFDNVDFAGAVYFGLGVGVDFTTDTDDDGIPDYFESAFGTVYNDGNSPTTGGGPGATDTDMGVNGPDGDGISDALEQILIDNGATGPITRMTDTDDDGISDYLEVADGTDPFNGDQPLNNGTLDSDADGLPDALEAYITAQGGAADPDLGTDTDSDGVPDFYEVLNGTASNDANDPVAAGGSDSDGDGLTDALEDILVSIGVVDPADSIDTDLDGLPDYMEAFTFSDVQNVASPGVPTGFTIRSLTSDYTTSGGLCTNMSGYQWIDITDQLGNLVFSINPVGNNLGSTCWGVRLLNGESNVRILGTEYIMNRNWYITPTTQPTSDVFIRFYTLNQEPSDLYDRVVTDGYIPGTFPLADFRNDSIRFTKISDAEVLNPYVEDGARELLIPVVTDFSTLGHVFTLGVGSFSEFVGHFIPGDPEDVLPIELLFFNAKVNKDIVELDWATASEINNERFIVERSIDGVHFEEVVSVAGAGNSTEVRKYHQIDSDPLPGEVYYRLKQLDFDGAFTYSALVRVDNGFSLEGLVEMYPNPTDGILTLAVAPELTSQPLEMAVYDLRGKKVMDLQKPEGKNVEIDLGRLKQGIYNIRFTIGDQSFNKKVIRL